MRKLPVELDDSTIEQLEAEREHLGFESCAEYVRWIVEHRADIESDDDGRARARYDDRIASIERRITSIERAVEPDAERNVDATDEPVTPRSTERGTESDVDGDAKSDNSRPLVAAGGGETTEPAAKADGGWTQPERSGCGSTTPSAAADAGISSMHLTPERVVRVRDDSLAEDAGELGSVEVERVDELSRRAVAETRTRLSRDVETGLEYQSATELTDTDSGCRPGADLTDLDDLSVPGRSTDLVDRRRQLVGYAVALLRDDGPARKADFVDALYDEYPAGYDSADGWWRCVKAALKQIDGVEGGDGSRIWRYKR